MKFKILDKEIRTRMKWAALQTWHGHFCWIPRRLDNETVAWLHFIQRRLDPSYGGSYPRMHMQYRTYQQALSDKT